MKAIILVALMAVTVSADTAYVIHLSEGVFLSDFVTTPDACGEETRMEMLGLLRAQPVVTVTDDSLQFTTRTNRDRESDESHLGVDAEGRWGFGKKTLVVSVRKWGLGDRGSKTIDVEVTRNLKTGFCRELWSGVVSPSETRETIRGR